MSELIGCMHLSELFLTCRDQVGADKGRGVNRDALSLALALADVDRGSLGKGGGSCSDESDLGVELHVDGRRDLAQSVGFEKLLFVYVVGDEISVAERSINPL
jgi:hypothetical protein